MQFWVAGLGLHGQTGVEDGHLPTALNDDGLSLFVQVGGGAGKDENVCIVI